MQQPTGEAWDGFKQQQNNNRKKEGHYVIIKGSIHKKDIIHINIYAPNKKQNL